MCLQNVDSNQGRRGERRAHYHCATETHWKDGPYLLLISGWRSARWELFHHIIIFGKLEARFEN